MPLRHLGLRLVLTAALGLAPCVAPAFAGDGEDAVAVVIPRPDRDRARMNQRVFDQVWGEVRSQYYDPQLHGVDWNQARRIYRSRAIAAADDRALYGALGEMLRLLNDDHAGVAPPAVARRQDQLRERRAAIGVTLRPDPEQRNEYTVEAVRDGSPAANAGVSEGWRLLLGDGDWSPEQDVVEGRTLHLTFADEAGAAHSLVITPVVMEPRPAFVAETLRPGVMVLRIEGFEPGLGRWMGDQLAELDPDIDVVIDMRGNPGGRLLEADAVLSCFLPHDQAWATRTARSGRRVVMRTAGGCGDLQQPVANDLAILVDGSSRSAAELTPAALQEAGRAVVVGEPTAGAVLISQESRLPDGGRLTLSRADFVTSGGVRLEKHGVTPDLPAAVTREDRRAGRDPALDAAIAALGDRAPHDIAIVRVQAP